jgi:hypothetical protein
MSWQTQHGDFAKSNLAKRWAIFITLGVIVSGTVGTAAAQSKFMDQAEIEKSWAVQRTLALIEQNKEPFVDNLLASWAPLVDTARYDLGGEIKAAAMQAVPWQLYGASLVGDFNTMIRLLRGDIGAAAFVNAYSEPQPKRRPNAKVLGASTNSLVFTPIAPCRIVDTRGTGARTGAYLGSRTFDVTTDGYGKGQGGVTSGCTGLPSFSYFAWALNITAVAPTGNYPNIGWLTAYGVGATPPTASVVNYFPGAYAIASNITVEGCYGCADDLVVSTNSTTSHVVIDVMGFYQPASGFTTGAVTSLAGSTISVAAGGFTSSNGGTCPAGTTVVGGGSTNSAFGTMVTSDHNISGTHWYEYVKNTGGSSASWTVYSICMDAP